MKEHLSGVGTVLGWIGIVICAAAVAGRFYGEERFLSFPAVEVFILGLGVLVLACWTKLHAK